MSKRITFKDMGRNVFVAEAMVTFRDSIGRICTAPVCLRLDGRDSADGRGYRVDMATSLGPYTAIDRYRYRDPMPGKAAARQFALRWLEAANAQQTLSPSL